MIFRFCIFFESCGRKFFVSFSKMFWFIRVFRERVKEFEWCRKFIWFLVSFIYIEG